jgi:lipoprotein-anchoring transpeptidase ErfK/SrfK
MAVMRQRGAWLGVASEKLGNGELGWVRAERVRLLREPWKIRVDLSERRATLLRRGRPYRSFAVAVGAPGYATPTGRFGVTDRLTTGGPGSPYGCCVLALSGRQPDVPQDWPGGDRLAIHGTDAPGTIGTAASHGCLRAGERAMRLLIAKVPLGTQVVIRP